MNTGTEYEPSTAAADRTWPDPLARRIGELLGALADPDTPDDMAVGATVRGLTLIPGIDNARLIPLRTLDDTAGRRSLAVGQRHLLELSGPATARADVMQAADLVARALAARLRDAPGPPSDNARSRKELDALRRRLVAESGDLDEMDVRVADSGAEWRTARIIARNLTDEPAVHGIVSHAIDVTALNRAQDRLRVESARLRTLVDSIQVAILVVDEDLRVVEVNAKALGLMGISAPPSSLVGMNLVEIARQRRATAPDMLAVAIEFAERAVGAGVPVYGEELRLPGGVVLEADYVPIDLDGEVRSHVLVGREVTGRAAVQHALEARNRELADLAMLKTEFLATVSHELRTPLTAVSSLLQLLGEDPGAGGQSVPRLDLVDALRRNTDRLLGIVEDLLLLARFEANQLPLQMERVPVRALLPTSLDQLRPVTEQNGDLADAHLVGDPHWLTRMVQYVMAGAFSSDNDGSGIVVRENVGAHEWTLTVSGDTPPTADTGQGGSQDRIGIRLSLTLARAIARRHGGDLRIESDNGDASITISLPTAVTVRAGLSSDVSGGVVECQITD